jgi:hypothetical protein
MRTAWEYADVFYRCTCGGVRKFLKALECHRHVHHLVNSEDELWLDLFEAVTLVKPECPNLKGDFRTARGRLGDQNQRQRLPRCRQAR